MAQYKVKILGVLKEIIITAESPQQAEQIALAQFKGHRVAKVEVYRVSLK